MSIYDRIQTPRDFYVYYGMDKSLTFTSDVTPQGYVYDSLIDDSPETTVIFLGKPVVITGTWGQNVLVDSWFVANTNAASYRIKFFDENNVNVFDSGVNYLSTRQGSRRIITQDNRNIVLQQSVGNLPVSLSGVTVGRLRRDVYSVRSFQLTLNGNEGEENVYVGELFVGLRTGLPRPGTGISDGLDLQSEAVRNSAGVVRGIRRITLSSFEADFPLLTNEDKEIIKHYLTHVQTVRGHLVDPFCDAAEEYEPFFGVLETTENDFEKLDNVPGFAWSISLEWKEAK